MNRFFGREVYIRLTDTETALVCTVKYGKLWVKSTAFALQLTPEALEEKALVLARKRSSRSITPDEL